MKKEENALFVYQFIFAFVYSIYITWSMALWVVEQ